MLQAILEHLLTDVAIFFHKRFFFSLGKEKFSSLTCSHGRVLSLVKRLLQSVVMQHVA